MFLAVLWKRGNGTKKKVLSRSLTFSLIVYACSRDKDPPSSRTNYLILALI